jgi:hypothetical protein
MLLCRVSLGDIHEMAKGKSDPTLRLPPIKAGTSKRHDSVIGFMSAGKGF